MEPPTKRCELPLFFAGIRQAIGRWKALDLRSLNMQFQQDWQKDEKNYSSFKFLPENLEKFRSTELYAKGIDNFSLSQLIRPYVYGKLSIS